MFTMVLPQMQILNIMHLATPASAILSALIFNAIIIPGLIPIAMKGVKYKPMKAEKMLLRNMGIFGLGGIIVPFVGIKLIDLLVAPLLACLLYTSGYGWSFDRDLWFSSRISYE